MGKSLKRNTDRSKPGSYRKNPKIAKKNVKKLAIGQVVYTAMCYENGTMIDDGTLFKLGDANFRWIGGSDYSGEWLREK